MDYQVVYFTRTGTSRRVAEKIAGKLSCKAIEITDNMDWKGPLGFVKGGFYATKNKPVTIQVNGEIQESKPLIVVSPLWAGKIAPAMETFLKDKDLKDVNLVVTSNGSTLTQRAGYQSITDIVRNKKNEDQLIEELIKKIKI